MEVKPTPAPLQPPASDLTLSRELWDQMQQHVARVAPEEACGLIAGQAGQGRLVFPITNQLHSPVRFHMAPDEQLRALIQIDELGLDLVAIYHSHPTGPDRPSNTDIAEAYYPESFYLIWSPAPQGWKCLGFSIQERIVREAEINVIEFE